MNDNLKIWASTKQIGELVDILDTLADEFPGMEEDLQEWMDEDTEKYRMMNLPSQPEDASI